MIPDRKSADSRRRQPGAVPEDGRTAPPVPPVPGWLRRAAGDGKTLAAHGFEPGALDDFAFAAGAAVTALDAVVRRRARWEGVWRQRLALAAAARTAREAGRAEDEAALRDAVLLTKAGDDVGPAGRMLLAWRRLAARPVAAALAETGIAETVEAMGLLRDDETASDLAAALRHLAKGEGPVGMLTGAYALAERHGLPAAVGAWLADALLAQRLGWTHAVPLLGGEAIGGGRSGAGGRPGRGRLPAYISSMPATASDRARLLLAAQARAALRAIDLSVELERRADRLVAVAPKLRAKASDAVVESLLRDDAIVASQTIAGISDRGLRRLFDRLIELGAVRELTGRPTFRIYGL